MPGYAWNCRFGCDRILEPRDEIIQYVIDVLTYWEICENAREKKNPDESGFWGSGRTNARAIYKRVGGQESKGKGRLVVLEQFDLLEQTDLLIGLQSRGFRHKR